MPYDPHDPSPITSLPDPAWLTHKQLASIGSVIVAWSWLDLTFESLMCTLVQSDEMLSQAFTEDLNPDSRLKAAKRLIKTWETVVVDLSDDNKSALQEATSHIGWIASKKTLRNLVAHRLWSRVDDAKMFCWKNSIKPAEGSTQQSGEYTASDLHNFSREIGRVAEELRRCEVKLRSLPPWPRAKRDITGILGMESLLGPYIRRQT